MTTPIELVTEFCSQWDESVEKVHRSFRQHFTDQTVWDNVGFAVTTGADEAIALWDSFEAAGFSLVRVDMLNIAAIGNVVLTERIDHLLRADGTLFMSAPLMGTFELKGDKVVRWSDYVDARVLNALMGKA